MNGAACGGSRASLRKADRPEAARVWRSAALSGGSAAALLLSLATNQALAINLNDPQAAAVGGIPGWYDTSNTYPNVVSLYEVPENTSQCTGTLINSRTILTAAHCIVKQGSIDPDIQGYVVRFNPDANTLSTNDRTISGLLANSNYNTSKDYQGGSDIALISLATPVTSITPVTLIGPGQALPAPGTIVRIVGYGKAGTGTNADSVDDSRRRAAETTMGAYWTSPQGDPGVLAVQFRNPESPDNPNRFNQTVPVPTWQAQPAPGDSGGPMFLVLADGSLLQIGTVIGGGTGYGATDRYTSILDQYDWIQQNNPLRFTSAVAGTWAWSNASAWLDTLGRAEVPNNAAGSLTAAPYGVLGRYYEVALTNASQVTVDMSPTVDFLTVANANASLNVLPTSTLTVVLTTQLNAGGVSVDGTLNTGWLEQSGGRLSGTGTLIVPYGYNQTGGVLAPGAVNALGTLTINGSYTQGSAATLAVRVDAAGSDRLAVTGRADLAGTLSLSFFNQAPAVGQTFAVVTAGGGIAGNFSQISASLPAFTWTTSVQNGEVLLTAKIDYVDDVPTTPTADVEAREAAIGVAKSLQALASRLPSAALQQAAGQVAIGNALFPATPELAIADLNTLNSAQLALALQTLPPVGFYGQTAFAFSTSRLVAGVLTDRLNEIGGSAPLTRAGLAASVTGSIDAETGPLVSAFASTKKGSAADRLPGAAGALGAVAPAPPAAPATPFGVFVAGSLVRSGPASETSYTTSGVTAGLDYRVSPGFTAGVAVTYVDDNRTASGMTIEGQSVAPTLYGRLSQGPYFVDAYLGYAFNNLDTRRLVIIGDELLTAQGKPKGGQLLAGAVAGVKLDMASLAGLSPASPFGRMVLTPFVGVDATRVTIDSYAETGIGGFAVGLASRDASEVRATAGLEASWAIPLSIGVLTPRLKASITQRFGDLTDQASAYFLAAPDLPFQLAGVADARTYGTLGVGLGLQAGEALSALVSYQADMDHSGLLDNRFTAKVQYRF